MRKNGIPEPGPETDGTSAASAFRLYAQGLHRYFLRRTRQSSLAVDLTQEVFERFLKVKDAHTVRNPQAYLFGIASHVVRETLFDKERDIVSFDSEMVRTADEQWLRGSAAPLEERLALQQELLNALRKLPVMHRTILLLIKRDGLSYKEAAEQLGLSENTITSYLFEARAKMKSLLEDEHEGGSR